MKKVLKITLIIVIVFITGLLIAPIFFKDKVVNILKENINQTVDANVDFKDVNLSFFKSFPELSVGIDDVMVSGKHDFEGVKLLTLKEFYASVNVMSLIKSGEINISQIRLENPEINLIELCDGKQNWNIVKNDEDGEQITVEKDETGSTLNLNIDKFRINHGKLTCTMAVSQCETTMKSDIEDINLDFSGDLNAEKASLNADFSIGSMSMLYDKIAYASKLKIESKIIIDADFKEQLFTLGKNSLSINAITTSMEGWVSLKDTAAIAMDLKMNTNDVSFKEILSLIPALYTKEFDKLNAEGNVNMAMWAKGELKDKLLPKFEAELKVENGSFGYEMLPSRVTDINIDLGVSSPGGNLDDIVASINKFHMNMAGNSLELQAQATNIETDINYYAKAVGAIDLAQLSNVYPMSEKESLKGKFNADMSVKGKMSEIEKELYENIEAKGYLKVEDIEYKSPELGVVKINSASMFLSPKYVSLDKFDVIVNSSDLSMNGRLENLIGYALNSKTLSGELNINSNQIILNDFMTSTVDSSSVQTSEPDSAGVVIIPKNLDFKMSMAIANLKVDNLTFNNLKGKMTVKDGVANISDINMTGLGGTIGMKGKYDTSVPESPKADFDFNIKNASFKKSFESIASLQKMAPIFEDMTGSYFMDFGVKTNILPDFSPDLNTLWAKGVLKSSDLSISNVTALDKMAEMLKYEKLKNLKIKDFDVSFVVENGRMDIKPVDIKAGNINMNIYGSTGLDQTIDMKGKVTLPSDGVKVMGMNVKNLPFVIKGTFSKPDISLDTKALTNEVKDNITSAVKDVIADKLGLKNDSINTKLDEMSSEKKAELVSEAKKQASKLVEEAEKQASKLLEKAGNNQLKKLAAQKAGETLVKEAKKQADKIVTEAEAILK